MNLTDYRITPMSQVFAHVEREAARLGVGICESEVVGLLPREALEEAAALVPWLGSQHRHQVLEDRLAAVWK